MEFIPRDWSQVAAWLAMLALLWAFLDILKPWAAAAVATAAIILGVSLVGQLATHADSSANSAR